MKDVVIDILFTGLLLIPLVLMMSPTLTEKLLSVFDQSLAKNRHYFISLPITVYLIYDMSTKSNWAAKLSLVVAFALFFTIYASALSCLLQRRDKGKKRFNADSE